MKTPLLLLAVLLLGGAVLYSIAGFKKFIGVGYIQSIQAESSAGSKLHSATVQSGFAWRTEILSEACQIVPTGLQHASALAIWTEYIDRIHKSSQIAFKDPDYEFHDLTAQLLHLISPRLPNSVKAIPRDWTSIQHVLERVFVPRWNYIMGTTKRGDPQSKDPPRPVRIVVFGGSVVSGVNCQQIFSKKVQHKMTRQQCAWPYRLQNFLDQIVPGEIASNGENRLFEVHTAVLGGSNTINGNAILEFDLLPPEAKNPDVIINAYATNDMHLQTFNQGDQQQKSWRGKAMSALQDFIRLAYASSTINFPCASTGLNNKPDQQQQPVPPVVMHLDDYLGNEQRGILATTELSQAVQVLSNYYGTLTAMSYPDLVRDWVYGDTHEFWFSPYGWYPPYKQNKQQMAREIHPGMPHHMVVPWIVSYNLLNLLTNYCDRHPYAHDSLRPKEPIENIHLSQTVLQHEYNVALDKQKLPLPALKQTIRFPGKPKVTPYGLPPPLSSILSLQNVTSLWKNQSKENELCASTQSLQPKCPFAWVSGLLNEHNSLEEEHVEVYFKNESLEYYNDGWEVKRHVDGRKMGFVPQQERPGANLTMVLKAAPSSKIRQVVVFYLKSYGERWDGSRLQVQLDQQQPGSVTWEHAMTQDLVGYHAKNTSEMYNTRLILQHPVDRIRFQAIFVSGNLFKIMGLLICR